MNRKSTEQPIVNRANSKKLQENRTKAQTNGGKPPDTEQTQTNGRNFENAEQNSNERQRMVAPTHNHTETAEISKNSRCGWEQVLHGPTVCA